MAVWLYSPSLAACSRFICSGARHRVSDFLTVRLDVGSIEPDTVQPFELSFANHSGRCVYIDNVEASCSCIELEWPRRPISPHSQVAISGLLATSKRTGSFELPVTVRHYSFDPDGQKRFALSRASVVFSVPARLDISPAHVVLSSSEPSVELSVRSEAGQAVTLSSVAATCPGLVSIDHVDRGSVAVRYVGGPDPVHARCELIIHVEGEDGAPVVIPVWVNDK